MDDRSKELTAEAAWDTKEAFPNATPAEVVAMLREELELTGAFTPQELDEHEEVALAALTSD